MRKLLFRPIDCAALTLNSNYSPENPLWKVYTLNGALCINQCAEEELPLPYLAPALETDNKNDGMTE